MLFVVWCVTCYFAFITVNALSWKDYCECWDFKFRNNEYRNIKYCLEDKILSQYNEEQDEEPIYMKEKAKECWELQEDATDSSSFQFKTNTPFCQAIRVYNASAVALDDIERMRLPHHKSIVHVIVFLFKVIGAESQCRELIERFPKQIVLEDINTALNMKKNEARKGSENDIPENCDSFKNQVLSKLRPWKDKRPLNLFKLVLQLCSESPSSEPCTYLLIYHIAYVAGTHTRDMETYPAVCDALRILLVYYDFHMTSTDVYENRLVTVNRNVLLDRVLDNLNRWMKEGITDQRIKFYYYSLSIPEGNGLFSNARRFCNAKARRSDPVANSLMCQFSAVISKLVETLREIFRGDLKPVDTKLDYKMYLRGEEIKGHLDKKLSQLGTYLAKIQEFERNKAGHDVAYVRKRLNRFGETLSKLSEDLGKTLFATSQSAGLSAIANQGLKTTIAVVATKAAALNPLFSPSTLNVMKAYAETAKATSLVIKHAALHNGIEKLKTRTADIAERFKKGMSTINIAVKYVFTKREKYARVTLDDDVEKFLARYGNYDPGVQKDEIKSLMMLWKTVFTEVCKLFQETSGNIVGAPLIIYAIEQGWCVKYEGQIDQLKTMLLDMYDFQRKFLESSALYLRAKLAEENAATLGKRVAEVKDKENLKIQEVIKLGTIIYEISRQAIIHKYCVAFEYRNGGVKAPECEQKVPDLSMLLPRKVRERNPLTYIIDIPEMRWQTSSSSISMESLFKGEDIFFEIPDYKWLIDNGGFLEENRNSPFYVKMFGIFLPVISKGATVVTQLEAVGESQLLENGQKYQFLQPYRTTCEYTEGINQLSCPTKSKKNPYSICNANPLPEFCPVSTFDTNVCNDENMIAPLPSIYSKWKINVFGYENYTIPNPATKITIKAWVVVCKHREGKKQAMYKRTVNGIREKTCCYGNNYYDMENGRCNPCPQKSKARLHGYYCRKEASKN